MADLDFSHNVSEIPAGQSLPAPYQKSERVEQSNIPDFQGALTNYAANTNWMSNIGSAVASKASNAIAQKLGSELGKDPKGDIGIPLTDFDEVMQKSYTAQSNATLGLQANKLITDSNIEMAKATRITPDLIQKTNKSVAIGLQSIFKNAPASIQPELQYHYGSLQLSQLGDLNERMVREQKEDRRNNTALANAQNTENAYTFGIKGNEKAGLAAVERTKSISQADVAAKLMTPEDAKAHVDAARKSYLNGKIAHDYEVARAQGKGEEYLKSVADGKVINTDSPDYMPVTNSLINYVGHQESLRNQDQALAIAKFETSIAMNPMAPDMTQQLNELKNNVTPVAYERAQLSYVNAVKAYNTEQGNVNSALAVWNDPGSFARLSEKGINKAFDMQVNRYVQQRQDQNKPISSEEAEVQVAASAGGKVPVFEKALENKLLSGSPQNIASAAHQMELLNNMDAGRVYAGVSTKAKAVATLFQQQRGSMPDSDLARQITDNLSNVDEKMQKTLDNSWSLILSTKGAGGLGANKSLGTFALKEVGLNDKQLGGSYFGTIYGNDIYDQLNSNFIATRGDYQAAVKMTKDYVAQHYSETHVNGTKQISDSSVEKYLGYKGDTITPYIQQDILNQLSRSFEHTKKDNPNDYWETLPLKNGVAEVVRNVTTKEGKKQFRYPVNLVGRAGNQWDVVVKTPYGNRNLFLVAPHVGVSTYEPNREYIEKAYNSRKIEHSYIGRA